MSGPIRKLLLCLMSIILLSVCAQGQAATANFGNGGDTGYESSTVDDVEIQFSQWNNNTVNGNICYVYYNCNEDTSGKLMLLGFADLMTRLPATSGGDDITISSATLVLTTQSSWGDNGTVKVCRMLTDWLVGTAGTNETNVHSDASDVSGSVEWGSDPDSTIGGTHPRLNRWTARRWPSRHSRQLLLQ